MPLDTSIAMGYRPMQMPNQLAQYAQMQQIMGGQQEQQLNALKMQEAQAVMQERNALSRAYSSSINPETGQIDYNKLTGLVAGAGAGAQLPGIEKTRRELETANLTQQKARSELLDARLKQSKGFLDTIDPTSPDAAQKYLAWHEANHRDPIVGAALKERGITADQSRQDIQAAIQKGPEALAQLITRSKLGTEKFMELNKPTTVAAGGSVYNPATGAFTQAPEKTPVLAPTNLAKLQTELAALPPGDPRRTQYEALIRKETTHAPGTTVTVSTEKKYGEAFGGRMAEADIGKLSTAEKAPQLAESANRIIDIVNKGNVFTGPAADIKLNIARALNVAGADNQQKIANTESLIASAGQSTLDAIKSAGLGTGQGFTDKDLKFLQGIAGGTINLTAQTLTELASLQHRAATRGAESWNKRVKEMPSEVLKGTGLSTTPITVPPLSAKKSAGPVAGTVQQGYRFKGGNPADQANWEKQ